MKKWVLGTGVAHLILSLFVVARYLAMIVFYKKLSEKLVGISILAVGGPRSKYGPPWRLYKNPGKTREV